MLLDPVELQEHGGQTRALAFLPLSLSNEALKHYGKELKVTAPDCTLESLARGLASNSSWPLEAQPVLLLRNAPRPLLAVVGRFLTHEIEGVRLQAHHLESACNSLRAFDYHQVAEDCSMLADLLRAALGPALRTARFVAIPKGGLTVLGLVSSALGLDHPQLGPPRAQDEILVVVDDCSVSGARFAQFIEQKPGRRVLFAHLCSHPELRRAIEEAEPRVEACLAVRDLQRTAIVPFESWPDRWRDRISWKTYWTGSSQALGFPWCEPDRLLWDPGTKQVQKAWTLLPPSFCLKNRQQIPVHTMAPEPGPIRSCDEVLYYIGGQRVYLANLASEKSCVLDPVASSMWLNLIRTGDPEQCADAICREFEIDAKTARQDLEQLMEKLVLEGFLSPNPTQQTLASETRFDKDPVK